MARFDPYENNGGTCVAVAGADYCVVAADTRLSVGYSILTRRHSKLAHLADKCVLASSGFQGDIKVLQKNLSAKELLSSPAVCSRDERKEKQMHTACPRFTSEYIRPRPGHLIVVRCARRQQAAVPGLKLTEPQAGRRPRCRHLRA